MSISIKRLVYESVPFCEGRAEGNWLVNHFQSSSSGEQETKIHITLEDLEECLAKARACDGNCEFFAESFQPAERKERHDEITKEMSEELPKLIAEVQKEDEHNSGWVDLEIWW